MARFYPSDAPKRHEKNAEVVFFRALKAQLGDEYVVIHSLPWLDDANRYLQEGECDFLILHPAFGFLTIETKSGDFTCRPDGKTGKWLWIRDDGKSVKDPYLQARASMHEIADIFYKLVPGWRGAKMVFGHAVALPQTVNLKDDLPPHAKPEATILQGDMDHLDGRIKAIFAAFGTSGGRLTEADITQMVAAILPTFHVVRSLSSRFPEEGEQLHRLTAHQTLLLEGLHGNRRMIIRGCSGSGKTLLAMECARRCAAAGKRVLLLCYNRNLAAEIQSQLGEAHAASIEVLHFHELCKQVCSQLNRRFPIPQDGGARAAFFADGCAEIVMKLLPEYPVRYDAIIVDEAQDFCDSWWCVVDELLKDKAAGVFYIFLDMYQNIYKRLGELPFKEPTFTLPVNCRNTAAIATWMYQLAGITGADAAASPLAPPGKAPEIIEVADDAAECEAVRKTLHRLLQEERLAASDIVVLGRHTLDNSAFAGHTKFGACTLVELGTEKEKTDIRYCTIHAFKGLEANCVLLTGVGIPSDKLTPEDERILTYVGASRACLMLYVFHRPGFAC